MKLPHEALAPVDLPCGDCRRCCTDWQVVGVTKQELRRFAFDVEPIPAHIDQTFMARFAAILRRRENGDCVYLGDRGCTIHERAPHVCRVFDCRMMFVLWERGAVGFQAAGDAAHMAGLMLEGAKRLHTLPSSER